MTKRQLVKWLEAKQSDAKAEVEIQYATAEKVYFAQRDEALKINETVDEEIRDDSKWEYAMDTLLKGHGDKSVIVLAQYFKLTEEEIMCIRYHMGAFCDKSEWNDYTRAVHKYTNVLWTHQADMLASHVEGV